MIQLQSLFFERAGTMLFRDLSFSFTRRRYGLVGHNGVGKSTLARVVTGEWQPTSGQIIRDALVGYVAQREDRRDGFVCDEFAELWSAPAFGHPAIHRWVASIDPARRVTDLSGGEWMKVRLAQALSRPWEFLILDEPTNDLDRDGREALIEVVRDFAAGLLVITHDRELLQCVDEILELTPKQLSRYRGTFADFWVHREHERTVRQDALRTAKQERRKIEKASREKLARQQKRMRTAARSAAKDGIPAIVRGTLKRRAESTQARLQVAGKRAVGEAAGRVDEALAALESDPFLRLDFDSAAPPAGKVLFEAQDLGIRYPDASGDLWPGGLTFRMCGRERWHLRGANGSGKSTLMRLLMGVHLGIVRGNLRSSGRPVAYLDQNQSLLVAGRSVLENFGGSSRFDRVRLRNELAFYGFTGEQVHQKVETLSGGERLRAALARMFLAECIPEIVLLDEPTNNLDFQSMELLEKALQGFRGLLVVVSHDVVFVGNVGVTNGLEL